jgi:hypothetical protein
MKDIIENIKARFFAKKFNIWTEKIDKNRKPDTLISGDWIYNGKLYYGNRWFIFFLSAENNWYKSNS